MLIYSGKHTGMFFEEEASVKSNSCCQQMEIICKWCQDEKQTSSYFPVVDVYPDNSPLGRMCLLEKGDFLSSPVEPFRWAGRKSGLRSWKNVGF